jgi:hypothetical protein
MWKIVQELFVIAVALMVISQIIVPHVVNLFISNGKTMRIFWLFRKAKVEDAEELVETAKKIVEDVDVEATQAQQYAEKMKRKVGDFNNKYRAPENKEEPGK